MSKIIFLNGCGSSGKTSIGRAIQSIANEPWILLGVDNFIDMLPAQYMIDGEKSDQGYFSFILNNNEHGQTVVIKEGPLSQQVFGALPQICKILADSHNNLIIDEVVLNADIFLSYKQLLASHSVCFVCVFCELKELQKREQHRGDRHIGLANDQFNQIHIGKNYDLTIDTTYCGVEDAARKILKFVESRVC